jgi:hypothetical protein
MHPAASAIVARRRAGKRLDGAAKSMQLLTSNQFKQGNLMSKLLTALVVALGLVGGSAFAASHAAAAPAKKEEMKKEEKKK